jgi:hypothetical protein
MIPVIIMTPQTVTSGSMTTMTFGSTIKKTMLVDVPAYKMPDTWIDVSVNSGDDKDHDAL